MLYYKKPIVRNMKMSFPSLLSSRQRYTLAFHIEDLKPSSTATRTCHRIPDSQNQVVHFRMCDIFVGCNVVFSLSLNSSPRFSVRTTPVNLKLFAH